MKKRILRLPVRLPNSLYKELGQSVLNEDYGFKGRSRWVEEAIHSLVQNEFFPELVTLDDVIEAELKPDTFLITEETREILDQALIRIKQSFPERKVTLSSIARTAIIQRLIRASSIPLEEPEEEEFS